MGLFKSLMDAALEAVFPSNIYCLCCGALIERNRAYSLCDECMCKVHWITDNACERCGKDLGENFRGSICYNCMSREHKFSRGLSCMTYGLYERQMILDYKYNGKGYMGTVFGEIMADKLKSEGIDKEMIDLIVPVPVHKSREKERGYNQSAIMAARLGRLTGISVREHGCVRTRETSLLRSMGPIEREAQMKGAFEVPEFEKQFVRDKVVLVIDDIITTGATVNACADAFLRAGAKDVMLLCLASGANKKPSGNEDLQ